MLTHVYTDIQKQNMKLQHIDIYRHQVIIKNSATSFNTSVSLGDIDFICISGEL